MVLRIATEPVLPFNALDIALEIQKRIEGTPSIYYGLLIPY